MFSIVNRKGGRTVDGPSTIFSFGYHAENMGLYHSVSPCRTRNTRGSRRDGMMLVEIVVIDEGEQNVALTRHTGQ
jgi:hypothetical protein